MTERPPPATCPSCGFGLVARVHGPWCPRCRGWIVLRLLPRWEENLLVPYYQWAVSII